MRILIVGASGTIGRAVVAELGQRHEIIAAGRSSGELRTDVTDSAAIRTMFERAGSVDAVVPATGKVKFAPFEDMGVEDYQIGGGTDLENGLQRYAKKSFEPNS